LKWYNFFQTFIETENSCCVPQFPLIASCDSLLRQLTAKLNSCHVNKSESGVGNFGKLRVGNFGS